MYDLNGKSFDFSSSEMKLIVTGSMDADPKPYDIPTIPINSMVMIKHLSQDQVTNGLKVGDVIAFKSGNIIITHRIVSIDPVSKTITTQGDANVGKETVAYTAVIGKVVGVNHWMGTIVHILQKYTLSILLGTIGLVSGYVAIKTSLQNIREDREASKSAPLDDENCRDDSCDAGGDTDRNDC